MQACQKCGKSIKYIATGFEKTVICETEIEITYNESGRHYKGYPLHKCKKKEEKGKECPIT